MNKKIKALDVTLYPDMSKFHQTPAVDPKKASELIYKKYRDYFQSDKLEIDLRNEKESASVGIISLSLYKLVNFF